MVNELFYVFSNQVSPRMKLTTRCVMIKSALNMCVYVWMNISSLTCRTMLYRYVYMHADSANLAQNITVSVASSQVQWCVVSTVHHVDAGSSHNEHVYHIGAALPTRPVQWTESVIISKAQTQRSLAVRQNQQQNLTGACPDRIERVLKHTYLYDFNIAIRH